MTSIDPVVTERIETDALRNDGPVEVRPDIGPAIVRTVTKDA
jgi:hypothetical protein